MLDTTALREKCIRFWNFIRPTVAKMFMQVWGKALDMLGPKLLTALLAIFIFPEVSGAVPSVADWLNLGFQGVESLIANIDANTSAFGSTGGTLFGVR